MYIFYKDSWIPSGALSHGGKSVPLCASKPAMPSKNCSCAAQETTPRPLFGSSSVSYGSFSPPFLPSNTSGDIADSTAAIWIHYEYLHCSQTRPHADTQRIRLDLSQMECLERLAYNELYFCAGVPPK